MGSIESRSIYVHARCESPIDSAISKSVVIPRRPSLQIPHIAHLPNVCIPLFSRAVCMASCIQHTRPHVLLTKPCLSTLRQVCLCVCRIRDWICDVNGVFGFATICAQWGHPRAIFHLAPSPTLVLSVCLARRRTQYARRDRECPFVFDARNLISALCAPEMFADYTRTRAYFTRAIFSRKFISAVEVIVKS